MLGQQNNKKLIGNRSRDLLRVNPRYLEQVRKNERKVFRASPYYYERVRGISLGKNKLDYLIFNIPPRCNYSCRFCFAGMDNKPRDTFSDILTLKEIRDLIAEAQDFGVFYTEISGEGEPLVFRSMLEDIIKFNTSQGIHTLISTNGSLLTKRFLEFLVQNDASLTISLDYLDKDRYEQFVNTKNVYDERVLKNIEEARQIFRKEIKEENGFKVYRLNIHTIVIKDNRDQIPLIRKYAGDDIFLSIASLMLRGNTKENSSLWINSGEVQEIINKYADGSIVLSNSSGEELGVSVCANWYYGIAVRYNGEILFNCHGYDTSGLIGNVRNNSLRNLVQKVREIRKIYLERFWDRGYCPLRNPNYDNFVDWLRSGENKVGN